METKLTASVTHSMEGSYTAALRREIERRVPELLQTLRDDRHGTAKLTAKRRKGALFLLSRVMTAEEIETGITSGPSRARIWVA